MSISCSTQFGNPPWCSERDFNCRAWFTYSLLGMNRLLTSSSSSTNNPSIQSEFIFGNLPFLGSHAEHTKDCIAWLNWSHKEEPPKFHMCFQCISICLWHKDCNAPKIMELSVLCLKVFKTPVPCLTLSQPCKFLPHRALCKANSWGTRTMLLGVPLWLWEKGGESLRVLTKLKHNKKVNRKWKKGQVT